MGLMLELFNISNPKIPAYYVDAANGNDINDGKSSASPWQTIAKVNGETFKPGDRILFKRGETWRERLIVPSSGVAGNLIVFGAYGPGDKPLLSGATLMGNWNDEGGNIYNTALTTEPTMVWFDDTLGALQVNKAALNANNEWWWDSNVLYIYSTTAPSGRTIESSTQWRSIDQNEKSYLRFENLKVEKAKSVNVLIDGDATDITVCNVDSDKSYNMAIDIGVAGGAAVTPSNVKIENCTITLFNRQNTSFSPGINAWNGTLGGDNLIIRNCSISSDVSSDNSGNSEDGIAVADGDNILIENNTISNVDHGIQMRGSGVNSKDVETFIIRYNLIDTYDDAIWLNGTSVADSSIYYNIVNSTGDQCFDIIGEGGTIYNNTCYAGRNNAIVLQTLAATKVIFKNNIISHIANNRYIIVIDDANSVDISNSTFDNNIYYRVTPTATFGTFTTAGDFTFNDWQTTSSQDANGLNENPVFTTPGTDFTLQSSSNCRDAGADVSLARDYAGETVPQETNPTMGAYEYVA